MRYLIILAMLSSIPATSASATIAQPANLIGQCNGKFYAAMEEDQFPEGCDWIESIRTDDTSTMTFNDGSQSPCQTIEMTSRASRTDIADALTSGADIVSRSGCVNFIIVDSE